MPVGLTATRVRGPKSRRLPPTEEVWDGSARHDGGMARGDSEDIEKLLREAEQTLSGGPAAVPVTRSGSSRAARTAPPARNGGRGVVRIAALSGAAAATLVFAVFALLPFLGAISGAAGAFVGVFLAVLIGRLRRR